MTAQEDLSRYYCLSEAQWEEIKECFPKGRGRRGFQPKIPNRKVFEAALYRARVGCPWRDVPVWYGYWHAIYMRWKRWVEAGVPQQALVRRYLEQVAAGALDLSLACLDSTSVRAHQHAAGAPKKRAARPWAARAGA